MEQHSIDVESNPPLGVLRGIVAAINVVILLPPILVQVGLEKIAKYLYIVLGVICHQRADRSFYLFGDHFLYPKAEVWKHVPFDEIFTFDFRNRFTCGEGLGCKLGVCARCTGMYLGLLIGLLISELLLQFRIPKIIPILFLIPLMLDGTIQTIAYIIAPEQGFYESTNTRRFFTGLLFGFGVGYLMISAIKPAIAKSK